MSLAADAERIERRARKARQARYGMVVQGTEMRRSQRQTPNPEPVAIHVLRGKQRRARRGRSGR